MDHVWCEHLAVTACLVMASVVNYVGDGDQHVGIYASRVNWHTCFKSVFWVPMPPGNSHKILNLFF